MHEFLTAIFLYPFASTIFVRFTKERVHMPPGSQVDSRKKAKEEYQDAYPVHIPQIYIFQLATTNFRVFPARLC